MQRLIQALLTDGRVDRPDVDMMSFAEIKRLLGLDDVLALRDKLEKR